MAGCGSTPPSHFYTLSATAKPAALSSSVSVSVGPVAVPAVVDRPEIVVRTGPNEVWLDEFNRWASPLRGQPRACLSPRTWWRCWARRT